MANEILKQIEMPDGTMYDLPSGEGSKVSVSATGTSSDEVKYITIDDVEYKLAGGGGVTPYQTNKLTLNWTSSAGLNVKKDDKSETLRNLGESCTMSPYIITRSTTTANLVTVKVLQKGSYQVNEEDIQVLDVNQSLNITLIQGADTYVYEITSGGGGSTVTVSDQGPATETEKAKFITIDDKTWEIAGSGGGSTTSEFALLAFEESASPVYDYLPVTDNKLYIAALFEGKVEDVAIIDLVGNTISQGSQELINEVAVLTGYIPTTWTRTSNTYTASSASNYSFYWQEDGGKNHTTIGITLNRGNKTISITTGYASVYAALCYNKEESIGQVQADWIEEDETSPAFIQNKPLDLVHISNDSSTIQADIIGGNGMHNYSTEEHIVGSWIDRKPIYEKVIELNNYSYTTSGTDIDLGELNSKIKMLINSFFCSWDPDTKLTQFISIPMWYNIEKKVFRYRAAEGLNNLENQTIYLIIQYTKTTD